MKNRDNSKLIGTIFSITGMLGIFLALSILITTWVLTPRLIRSSKSLLSSSSAILNTTSEGLLVLKQSLETTETSLEVISFSVDSLSNSFVNLNYLSNNTGDLIGNNFVNLLDDTKISLDSSSKSAKLVDETLKVLAGIPLLGLDFRPDVPLHSSLADLSADITILKNELLTIEGFIDQVSNDFSSLDQSTRDIDDQISSFSTQIANAKSVVDSYILIIDQFSTRVSNVQEHISLWINIFVVLLSLLLIWLGLINLMPLLQARDIMFGKQHYVNIHDIRKTSSENLINSSEESNE